MMRLRSYAIVLFCLTTSLPAYATDYSTINPKHYKQVVSDSRHKIQQVLTQVKAYRDQNTNSQLAAIIQQLENTAYGDEKTGEGDWQPTAETYTPGAMHVNQNPVYRLDFLDCQTFVQTAMALLYANNLNEFEKNYLKIAYGAAGNPNGEIVRYYNRNNFVDGDLNPVNERNGYLVDVTTDSDLISDAKETTATITRQNWFLHQQNNLAGTIHVLSPANGPMMVDRFKTVYAQLNYPHFNSEKVTLSYIPKYDLAIRQPDGNFEPNEKVLNKIPTPAVAEIVTDTKSWDIGRKNIKQLIGTELSVSHLGLLYRQTFKHGETIYHKIYCEKPATPHRVCDVTPVVCAKAECNELMFAHATHIYPEGMYWYQEANGNYVCSSQPPASGKHYTSCNRVTSLPFYAYLTEFQSGAYWYMNNRTILGVHFEKLTSKA